MIEEGRTRGTLWFWSALAGVSLALFFGAFGLGRMQTLWLLCRGLVIWVTLYTLVRIAGAIAGIEPLLIAHVEFVDLPVSTQLYLAATLMLSSLLAGVALGGIRGAEVNGAAPLAMFWAASTVVAPCADWLSGTGTWQCTLLYLIGIPLCYLAPLLMGGAIAGRRAAVAGHGAHG